MSSSFLTIAGIPCLVIADNSAAEQPREYGGSLRRAWDGTLRNTTRWQKRNWAFTIAPMLQADYEALDTAIALRKIVACAGAALGASSPRNCSVELQSGSFIAAHNETQSAPVFYSLTVGDGTWAFINHTSRVAGNFVCSDGIALDLIGDNSAAVYVNDQQFVTLSGSDPKIARFRVARSGATIAGFSLFDNTLGVHRLFMSVDFTTVVPTVNTGGTGQLLSVVDRGDGSYEITARTLAIVDGHTHLVIVYPAVANVSATGQVNIGNISVWDDQSLSAGYRRTMAVTLMEA